MQQKKKPAEDEVTNKDGVPQASTGINLACISQEADAGLVAMKVRKVRNSVIAPISASVGSW